MKLEDILKETDKPVLLQFFAEWCGPCKMLSRIIDDSMDAITEQVELKRIDVDVDSELAAEFYVRAVPTMVLVSQRGDVLWKHTGVMPAQDILRELKR
ncbi:MAG: thioredoxin fold domain-containing protein [Flavobacteriaceae bacterium]|jgi:thioredoxin 1|nr:thioredoxin fold domain-containing protein [Flavobacteriaceae bacterium]